MLKVGQAVKAQVLEVDVEKRRMRLGMKQLVPTSLDEYIGEHAEGDVVTGRMVDVSGGHAKVELGEGIQATCRVSSEAAPTTEAPQAESKTDVSSLSSMLKAKWKGGTSGPGPTTVSKREPARAGQIRSFRIVKLDAASKKIELEIA